MVIIVRAKIHCHPSLQTSTSLPLELGCDCNSVHYIPQTVKPNGNPCVCVHVCKKIFFKQGRKGVYRHHSQRKTISIIILECFCMWYKSRRFFRPLFQLLPIIGFMTPPLSKSHVVVTVSNATRTPIHENTGGINPAMYVQRGARGKYSINTPCCFQLVNINLGSSRYASLVSNPMVRSPSYSFSSCTISRWLWQLRSGITAAKLTQPPGSRRYKRLFSC